MTSHTTTRWHNAVSRIIAISMLGAGIAGPALADGVTIIELRQNGWVVEDHTERVEPRESLAHYGQAQREVAISEYRLVKDGAAMRCVITYDNQLDSVEQDCVAAD